MGALQVRKFTIKYTKHVTKKKPQLKTNLENQLKKLDRKMDEDNLSKYDSMKNELNKFTTTSQKAHELGVNATGMNMAKNRQNFFQFRKTTRISNHNKKACC